MRELLTSKKFIASIMGVIVTIAGKYGLELDETALATIISPILAYIVGQGIADHGKNKTEVENLRSIISDLEYKISIKDIAPIKRPSTPESSSVNTDPTIFIDPKLIYFQPKNENN